MDKFEVGAEVAQMMSKMLSVGGTSPKIMISTETGIIQVTSPSGSRMTYSDVPFCCVPDCWKAIEQQSVMGIAQIVGVKLGVIDLRDLKL